MSNKITEALLDAALGKVDGEPFSEGDLESRLNVFGYNLRMFWLMRTDKIARSNIPLYIQLTNLVLKTRLPEIYIPRANDPILFEDQNHRELERKVVDAMREAYRRIHYPAPESSVTGWRKAIRTLFGPKEAH